MPRPMDCSVSGFSPRPQTCDLSQNFCRFSVEGVCSVCGLEREFGLGYRLWVESGELVRGCGLELRVW